MKKDTDGTKKAETGRDERYYITNTKKYKSAKTNTRSECKNCFVQHTKYTFKKPSTASQIGSMHTRELLLSHGTQTDRPPRKVALRRRRGGLSSPF